MASMTIGRKIETMALADVKWVEAGHLTLMQWLGWSGFFMWTGIGLLLAPFMLLVPAVLVTFLLLVPHRGWPSLRTLRGGTSSSQSEGGRKALQIAATILGAQPRLQAA